MCYKGFHVFSLKSFSLRTILGYIIFKLVVCFKGAQLLLGLICGLFICPNYIVQIFSYILDNYLGKHKCIKPFYVNPAEVGDVHEPRHVELLSSFRNDDGSVPDEYLGVHEGLTAYPYFTDSNNYPYCVDDQAARSDRFNIEAENKGYGYLGGRIKGNADFSTFETIDTKTDPFIDDNNMIKSSTPYWKSMRDIYLPYTGNQPWYSPVDAYDAYSGYWIVKRSFCCCSLYPTCTHYR